MNLNDIIPAKYRKPIYVAYALVGVALGAIATAYGPDNVPEWHAVATNVVLYVGGAFGLTAAANVVAHKSVPSDTDDAPEVVDDDFEDEPLDADEDDEDFEVDEVDTLEAYKANEQANLDAALLADIDETPPSNDYQPKH